MDSPDNSLATFRQAYFGPIDNYLAWHDGFQYLTDLSCLDALTPAQQQQAAEELLAGLRADTADARAMLGLGHLRYAEALPLLHRCISRRRFTLYALEAIAQINPAGLYPPMIARQLIAESPVDQLIDLLVGLREYYTLPQVGATLPPLLFALLTHSDYLVRYHTLEALRRLYGSLTTEEMHDPQRISTDNIFSLISKRGLFATYGKAQRLLLAELPAATLAAFPLRRQ
ncbi:MAG: hypothetical protein EOO62_15410 [Hymenobacter sp.]|nr:MAG: hypothetical protein EOO62_15410 [Hymenobacter sp.]